MSAASLASSSEEQTATTGPRSEEELDLLLSEPSAAALAALERLDSDLIILGVSGKMGPTLARMAVRALDELNSPHRVYGVARFSQPGTRDQLEAWGVQTITCDLLDRSQLASLPDSGSVIYMAGQKFGTTGSQHMTWGINTYLPALICERYLNARIVAFSTGNVYPLAPVVAGGPLEDAPLDPVGEYAMSCLGRERIFDYFSRRHGLRCAIVRLNYAVEMRYGVLVDIARQVHAGEPVTLDMGAANVIWQGDANAQAIALLDHCAGAAVRAERNRAGDGLGAPRSPDTGGHVRQRAAFQRRGGADGAAQQRGQSRAAFRIPARVAAPDAAVDRRLGAERRGIAG